MAENFLAQLSTSEYGRRASGHGSVGETPGRLGVVIPSRADGGDYRPAALKRSSLPVRVLGGDLDHRLRVDGRRTDFRADLTTASSRLVIYPEVGHWIWSGEGGWPSAASMTSRLAGRAPGRRAGRAGRVRWCSASARQGIRLKSRFAAQHPAGRHRTSSVAGLVRLQPPAESSRDGCQHDRPVVINNVFAATSARSRHLPAYCLHAHWDVSMAFNERWAGLVGDSTARAPS